MNTTMNPPPAELLERLLRILHRGFVEARNLALRDDHPQLADLADALESLPTEMTNWNDDALEAVRFNLQTYEEKYRGRSWEYSKLLEEQVEALT